MRLIPFLRFGKPGSEEEEEGDGSEPIELPPNELFDPPSDEEEEKTEEEEKPEEEEQEKPEDDSEEKRSANDDEMLKVFMAVEEEFVDNSGLASQIEDVPADELLQELRALAPAFGIRVAASEEEAA